MPVARVDVVRQRVAGAVRTLVAGSREPISRPADPAAPGMVAANSPVRQVLTDPAAFIGGVRSLLIQTLQPQTMYAVAEHSDYRNDPLGRLQRTAHFLGSTTFGSQQDADQAIAVVRSIHARVRGEMPDGTPYRADDPWLLGWVHATEVDSFLRAHQRFGATRLNASDADRYVADMAPIGEALGVIDAPRSREHLAATLDGYRPELRATPECRETVRFLFAPPLPRPMLPFYGLIFGSAVALLPAWARPMLLLPLAPGVDPLLVRPATVALTGALRWAMTVDPR